MRITDSQSVKNAASARRKAGTGNVGGADFSGFLDAASDTSGAQASNEVAATNSVSGIFALQEISEEEVARKKLVQHGTNLLDSLEQLRHSLLMGRLSIETLRTLESRLKNQRAQTVDPELHALMDDIELRAAVELAKWEKSRGE